MTAPFFIASPPRTGGTLLTRLLCAHPEVECIREAYLLSPDNPDSILHPDSPKRDAYGFTPEQCAQWAAMIPTAICDSCSGIGTVDIDGVAERIVCAACNGRGSGRTPTAETYRAMVLEIVHDYGTRTGATHVGISWPFLGLCLDLVRDAFPDAPIVYSVRDPRAIWWSGRQKGGTPQWADGYLNTVLSCDDAIRLVDSLAVKYEQLTASEADAWDDVRWLWRGLGLDPGIKPERVRDPERWQWVPNAAGPLDTTRADAWRSEMSNEIVRRINAIARVRAYCETYGYDPDAPGKPTNQDIFSAWLAGDDAVDLSVVRGEARRARNGANAALDALYAAQMELDDDIGGTNDTDPAGAWGRGYQAGYCTGKAQTQWMIGHIINRVAWEGLHEDG